MNYNSELQSNNAELQAILNAVNALPEAGEGGAAPVIEALTATENGTYTAADGVDGYSPVVVDVPSRYEEGYSEGHNAGRSEGYTEGHAAGYDEGFEASQDAIALQEKTATENGEVTADTGYTGLSKVTVAVPEKQPKLQSKNVTPSKLEQIVTSDSEYDGLSHVGVDAIPDEYITTTDATAEETEIFHGETAYVNGVKKTGTFTIAEELSDQDSLIGLLEETLAEKAAGVVLPELDSPASAADLLNGKQMIGQSGEIIEGAMQEVYHAEPIISVDADGLIIASTTLEEGHVQGGTKSATKQLPTKAGTTIAPTTSEQLAVAAGTFVTGDIKVAAAEDGSNGGNSGGSYRMHKQGIEVFVYEIWGGAEYTGLSVVGDYKYAISYASPNATISVEDINYANALVEGVDYTTQYVDGAHIVAFATIDDNAYIVITVTE